MSQENNIQQSWPLWQKILFQFIFIYFVLNIASLAYFKGYPYTGFLAGAHRYIFGDIVTGFNNHILHFRDTIAYHSNNDDTPYKFVQMVLYITLAIIGTIVWSLMQPNKKSYNTAAYYLKIIVRYFIVFVSFKYGIVKLFALQMSFPALADMATPFGDYMPVKLFWKYSGYSTLYQMFSGAVEVLAGILLLNRRTSMLGALVALAAYGNVMIVNMCYDIPVKIFSIHLVIMCLYLLITDRQQLADFFIYNKPTAPNLLYNKPVNKLLYGLRFIIKIILIASGVYLCLAYTTTYLQKNNNPNFVSPIPHGFYNVDVLIKNGDTLPVLAHDTLLWKDIIFERNYATVNTADTLLHEPDFTRGKFYYRADTVNKKLVCYKLNKKDSIYLFTFKYNIHNKGRVELRTKTGQDSLYLQLVKSKRKFILNEKPFHWVTESKP
jgi:hypothetical protein